MDPAARRRLGSTEVWLTQLGFGGAGVGELTRTLTERESLDTFDAAWDAGIRYFDSGPLYGRGLSEPRTGAGLRKRDRSAYVLRGRTPPSGRTDPVAAGPRRA